MTAESDGRRSVATDELAPITTEEEIADTKDEGLGSKAPQIVKRYRPLHLTWQIGVLLVGFAIVVGGVAMLALPGPGWVAIFLGLAVLGTEFIWAQRVLRWSKRQATKAASRALDPAVRRRNIVLLSIGVLLVAASAALYIRQLGFRLPW